MVALANAVETVAGSHNPGIRARTLQVFAEILEHRGVFRRDSGEVIEGLVDAGDQAGGGHVVAQDSPIDDLGEESRLRNEFAHQVRNVFLTFRRKRLLVPRPAAERDDHDFSLLAGASARAIALGRSKALPSARPAAVRRKSRRLQASCRASSRGPDAAAAARPLAVCNEKCVMTQIVLRCGRERPRSCWPLHERGRSRLH